MTRNRLYTVNKWNRQKFIPKENVFEDGGWASLAQKDFQKNPWNYSQDYLYGGGGPDITEQYMNSKNAFGISKKDNPFSKGNIGSTTGSIGASIPTTSFKVGSRTMNRGMWDMLDPLYYLSDAKHTNAVGNGFSDAGVGLTKAGLQSGNGWLALAGGISKGIGSFINAGWGGEDKEVTEKNILATNHYNNYNSNVGDWNQLKGPSAVAYGGDAFSGGWFRKGWASRNNKQARKEFNTAVNHAYGSLTNNVNNLFQNDVRNDRVNITAFGGDLDMGSATNYNFMTDYLTMKNRQVDTKGGIATTNTGGIFASGGKIHINPKNKGKFNATKKRTGKTTEELTHSKNPLTRKRAIFALNSRKWRHDYGGPLFAFGGDMETNISDFPTGLIHIDAGGTHSENPYDGVQMGVDREGNPNLVEEGEVVYDDYVFSNRIYCDEETKQKFHISKKREITFAELAKKLEKEIAERPNDPISEAGFKAQMQTLEEEQERQKQEMEAERAREAFEALPPEEQVAIMNRAAQEEQMAQQAMQEQALAQQAAVPSGNAEGTVAMPEEAMMQQQVPVGDVAGTMAAPQMQAEGGNLFAVGGVKPYAYSRNWDDFAYFNPETNSYDEGYLNFVRNITQDWVDKILAGQYGPMSRYLARNRGVKLTPEQVIALGTDKRNSDMHRALAAAYKEYYDKQKSGENHSFEVAPKSGDAFYKALKNKNFRDWWEEYINKPRGLGKYINAPDEEKPLAGKRTDFKRLYKFFTGKDDLEDSGDVYAALEALYNTNPELFLPFDSENYDYIRALRTPLKESTVALDKQSASTSADDGGTVISESELEGMGPENEVGTTATGGYTVNGVTYPTEEEAIQASNDYAKGIVDNTFDAVNNYKLPEESPIVETPTLTGNPIIDELNSGQGKPIRTVVKGGTPTMPSSNDNDATRASLYDFSQSAEGQEIIQNLQNRRSGKKELTPSPKDHWMRYAGLFGPAVGLGMMAAGVGKPDYSRLDAALASLGEPVKADYKPIGNYLTYRPMDIWYEQNRLNANARATDRAIMNNAAPVGTKMAGLLANAYNNQLASGNLYRQALEYNDNKKAQVEGFNRGTDQYNSQAYNQNSMFNAQSDNAFNQARARLGLAAAQTRLDNDAGWYNSLYGNVNTMFKGVSDLGRDKTEKDWLKWLVESGALKGTTAAYGGKLFKKRKRGLTC